MKHSAPWPATVIDSFTQNHLKKSRFPKSNVLFFDVKRQTGKVCRTQIFKFEDNFSKFSKTKDSKLLAAIKMAKNSKVIDLSED